MFKDILVPEEQGCFHENSGKLLPDTQAQIGNGIVKTVIVELFIERPGQFYPNQNEKYRNR